MRLLKRFWSDDCGFVVSTETIGIATLLVCTSLVGWQSVRVATVAELADLAEAIGALDQSYSFSGFQGHAATCSGSHFDDTEDFGDDVAPDTKTMGEAGFSRCIELLDGTMNPGEDAEGAGDVGPI